MPYAGPVVKVYYALSYSLFKNSKGPARRPFPKMLLFDREAGVDDGGDFLIERRCIVHAPV